MNKEWCLLFEKFIDGDLSDQEQILVAELHSSDPDFQEFWQESGAQYSLMVTLQSTKDIKSFLSATLFLDEKIRQANNKKNYFSSFLKLVAAILVMAIPAFGYYYHNNIPNVEFSSGKSIHKLDLLSGDIQLGEFDSVLLKKGDVEVAVSGPAKFRIGWDSRLKLHSGSVHINTYSKGSFPVETAMGIYSDIGTEFGLNVGSDFSEVHVFDGKVQSPEGGNVEQGKAQKLTPEKASEIEVDRGKFISFNTVKEGDLRYKKFLAHKSELLKSEDVLEYFDFTNLTNSSDEISGVLNPGFKVSLLNTGIARGPFPGSTSLDFKKEASFLKLKVPEAIEHYAIFLEFYHQKYYDRPISILNDVESAVAFTQPMSWFKHHYGKKGYLDERFWKYRGQLITVSKNYFMSSNLQDTNSKTPLKKPSSNVFFIGMNTEKAVNFDGTLSRIIIFKNNDSPHLQKLFDYNKSTTIRAVD